MQGNELFGMALMIIGIYLLLFRGLDKSSTKETDMGKKKKRPCCGGTKK